ncbi:MAG TPA: carboxypeptidase-like regulatory domain-containing protein, partial [Candidatus Wallbacteria bacterium]|nr:carboxypeptidase-like regulatory domain-containing protein [Candidatus Wallbacteria bacterium]
FAGVAPGDYILSAALTNDSTQTVLKNEMPVSLTDATREYFLEKPIELYNASTLEITLTDESGAPVQSARVFLNGLKNHYTNKKGSVSFVQLTEGAYKIDIAKEGFRSKTEYVTHGDTAQKLTFALLRSDSMVLPLSVSELLVNNGQTQVYEGDTISVCVTSDNLNDSRLKFNWQVSGGFIESTTETVADGLTKSEIKWAAPVADTVSAGLFTNYSIGVAVDDGKCPAVNRSVIIKAAKRSAGKISITSVPASAAGLKSAYNYKIVAVDENSNIIEPSTLSYDIKANPSIENDKSFILNAASGEISWMPAVRGKFDFILKARASGGNYAIQQFSVVTDDYIDELKPGETFSKTVLKPGSGLSVTLKNFKTSEYVIAMPYNTSETDISSFNISFYKTNAAAPSMPKAIARPSPARAPGSEFGVYGDMIEKQFNFEKKKRKRDYEFLKKYSRYIDYGATAPKAPLKQAAEPLIGSQKDFMIQTSDYSTDNGWIKLPARLMSYGKHCYVYVENETPASYIKIGSDYTDKIAESFDRNYEKITSVFGSEPNPGLDGDSRVYILASHYVNKIDAAGYFAFNDAVTQKHFDESSDPN